MHLYWQCGFCGVSLSCPLSLSLSPLRRMSPLPIVPTPGSIIFMLPQMFPERAAVHQMYTKKKEHL